MGFSGVVASRSYSLLAIRGLLTEVASPVAEHGLWSVRASVVVAHRLSYSKECGIFPDQGLNPCLWHWQMDSYPLSHQGSPSSLFPSRLSHVGPFLPTPGPLGNHSLFSMSLSLFHRYAHLCCILDSTYK